MNYKVRVEDYHKTSLFHHNRVREFIKQLEFKGNEKILDLGCADGQITAEIATYVPYGFVLGIDICEEMINFAQDKYKDFNNLKFQYGDTNNLKFNEGFDLISSFGCLHYSVNHLQILAGISRSLRQSGKAILQFQGRGNVKSLMKTANELMLSSKWKSRLKESPLYGLYNVEEYRELLKIVGLQVKKLDLYQRRVVYGNREESKQYLQNTWVSLQSKIIVDLYEEFIDDLLDLYMESNHLNNFVIGENLLLEIVARKI